MSYTTIEVCCDDSSHDQARPVETFAQTGAAEWVPLPELLRGRARTSQRIDALTDAYLDPSAPLRPKVVVRDRYRLHCDRCGTAVTVRAERLGVILDTLTSNGVKSIALAPLAARLRTQA